MSLCVLRVKNSGYFPDGFNEQEQKVLTLDYALGDFEKSQDIILITNTDTTSEEILELNQKHSIKLVIHPNSGYDNFSVDLMTKITCPFILGNSIRANAVAEHIISCFVHHHSMNFQSEWNRDQKNSQRKLMKDSQVLVFGKGLIGNILEKRLSSLVNELNFIDPYLFDSDYKLEDYDALILACSLNKFNHHLIDENTLNKLKPGSVIINSARGQLLDWKCIELFHELDFYIDVFPNEPFEIEKYSSSDNLFLTSHLAGCHKDLVRDILNFESQIVRDFRKMDIREFFKKYHEMDLRRKIKDGEFI